MRIRKFSSVLVCSVILLSGCGGEDPYEPPDPSWKAIHQPLSCLSFDSVGDRILSFEEFPGSGWLNRTGWRALEETISWPHMQFADEFGNQRDLQLEQALDHQVIQLGLFYPSHTYQLKIEVKAAASDTPANIDLSLLGTFPNQLFMLPLADVIGVGKEWQTIEAEFDYASVNFYSLRIKSEGQMLYRNLQLTNLTAGVTEPYDYAQTVGHYISDGWSMFGLNELGEWTDEIVGTSLSLVEWPLHEGTFASCSQDQPYSTDYLFKPLFPGHKYQLTAYVGSTEFPMDAIKLIAYGAIQSKLPFVDGDTDPLFLRKEIQGEPTINQDNAQIVFEIDSRQMSSLTIKLTSGDLPIQWDHFELIVID